MRNGYVYAARVPGDKLVKIGRTVKRPEERLSQLNNTSVPIDYENEFVMAVGDPVAVERAAHQILEKCRFRNNREFFQCSASKARSAIKQAAAGVKERDTGSIAKRLVVNPVSTFARLFLWHDSSRHWPSAYNFLTVHIVRRPGSTER